MSYTSNEDDEKALNDIINGIQKKEVKSKVYIAPVENKN
jgi:hypothetical protein